MTDPRSRFGHVSTAEIGEPKAVVKRYEVDAEDDNSIIKARRCSRICRLLLIAAYLS